ncbi:MAG: DsbA family protein [Acidobacteriota bacterium]|nr:DsbA family protein [Acidobacteriota bacterium]
MQSCRFANRKLFTVALLGLFSLSAGNAEEVGKALSKAEIEQIVHDYLLQHPDIVIESTQSFQRRAEAARQRQAEEALKARQEDLLHDSASPVLEAAVRAGKGVAIVEFFDYRCGYCKRISPTVTKMLADNPEARLIFKELPILGPESIMAAKAALAANKQGAYAKFHDLFMDSAEPVTPATVEQAAAKLGLDVPRLKADMESPEIQKSLDRNCDLASALGLNATPTFVIGEDIISGAMDAAAFQSLITKAQTRNDGGAHSPEKAGY